MPTLFEQVETYFRRDGWPVERDAGEAILQTGYRGAGHAWTCYAHVLEEEQQFVFYSVAPVAIGEKKRRLASEYLTRANFGLVLGGFEMDLDSGLVRCKTSIDVEADRLSYELFRPLVYANVFLMERYLPGLLAVVDQNAKPQDAIDQAEAAP